MQRQVRGTSGEQTSGPSSMAESEALGKRAKQRQALPAAASRACGHARESGIIGRKPTKGNEPVKDPEPTAAITRADVRHVADLARLALSDEEEARFQHQLSGVFAHFQQLSALDTEQIPPTAQVIPLQNVMRPDAVAPSLPAPDVLANAPEREGDQFRVRAILDF